MTEGVDTSTSTGKLMFGIISAFAQFERDLIRERTMAGLERARKNGKRLGRPRKVFNRAQAERMKAAGMRVRQIAEKLGVSKSVVQREMRIR
jgi:DNA invertase Pin-like site-specific DNA recombinase